MDTSTKTALGLLLLNSATVLLWTTVLCSVRRWTNVEPVWTWRNLLGRFLLLALCVTTLALIPHIGPYLALVVSLIGVKRLSGLDVLSAYILSFFLHVIFFIAAIMMGKWLGVPFLPITYQL
ncbi:MAG: hypothetical protein AB7K24_16555 [Gemmataceae bacterium]